ncbi:hypothetical protein IFM89_019005 [Coptis chinensis]|uniref:Endonuclease/exonuclease/phosphatase domain-containing protein n=1 Tax=Coptis chinensis TaxID=261450 RepID=A0A835I5A1_9MAGN|nr:hypothetical protein IFM89_019005 [Coptis chinensis]
MNDDSNGSIPHLGGAWLKTPLLLLNHLVEIGKPRSTKVLWNHLVRRTKLKENGGYKRRKVASRAGKEPTPPPTRTRTLPTRNFVHNDIPSKTGFLWVFWKEEIKATAVVSLTCQHITIQFDKFTVSTVYASTSYVIRRALWHDLTGIGSNVDVWMVIGDFNCITQASERKGGGLPCQRAVNEFVGFMNTNCLLDSTTLGHRYSWSNRRFGHKRMVQKIDRALVNQSLWIDL